MFLHLVSNIFPRFLSGHFHGEKWRRSKGKGLFFCYRSEVELWLLASYGVVWLSLSPSLALSSPAYHHPGYPPRPTLGHDNALFAFVRTCVCVCAYALLCSAHQRGVRGVDFVVKKGLLQSLSGFLDVFCLLCACDLLLFSLITSSSPLSLLLFYAKRHGNTRPRIDVGYDID